MFSRAPGGRVTVASLGGAEVETDGLRFGGLADLAQVERCDVLCVPGGLGTTAAMLDEAFMAEVSRLGSDARYLTSVCTGSLILAASGLIRGRRAACHWAWRDLLKLFEVEPDPSRVARDGNLITGGGVTAGLDFAFVLVAELAGVEVAQRIQLGLEYAPAAPFESGRPETASAGVLEAVRRAMEPLAAKRRAEAEAAAARLALA